ncbi:hypothetical protein Dimus_000937 [Dionaea muscipula]
MAGRTSSLYSMAEAMPTVSQVPGTTTASTTSQLPAIVATASAATCTTAATAAISTDTATGTDKSATEPSNPSPKSTKKLDTAAQEATDPSKKSTHAFASHHHADSLSSDGADFVTIPSYSKWFKWDAIHECEVRLMPEFFDGKSPSKNPSVYKYYRNSIVKKYRVNPVRKIAFTEIRRTLVGDVGSIRRVFDFLETWGLINYSPSGKQAMRLEEKEKSITAAAAAASSQASDVAASESALSANAERAKKICSFCKTPCSIACFVSEKYNLILCARCYVRHNSGAAVNSSEFKRVEIFEPSKTDWTDKETLQLLEAVTHYGDNWRRVAEHVGGRSEKECVARFIKLPFGEQFVEHVDAGEEIAEFVQESSSKRMRITPLADASNPILAQAAFLSALAGVDIAEAAAQAAVTALHDIGQGKAESVLQKEEGDLEKAISYLEVQMQEIQDKITHYEDMEFQLDKDWEELNRMKHQLFVDQLALLFHKPAAPESGEITVQETDRPD